MLIVTVVVSLAVPVNDGLRLLDGVAGGVRGTLGAAGAVGGVSGSRLPAGVAGGRWVGGAARGGRRCLGGRWRGSFSRRRGAGRRGPCPRLLSASAWSRCRARAGGGA